MKKVLLTLAMGLFIMLGTVNASFPVKGDKASNETVQISTADNASTQEVISEGELAKISQAVTSAEDDDSSWDNEDWTTFLLWFFLWPFAAHRWYKKKPVGMNILFILTFGGCGIWAIIDLVKIIQQDF